MESTKGAAEEYSRQQFECDDDVCLCRSLTVKANKARRIPKSGKKSVRNVCQALGVLYLLLKHYGLRGFCG